MLLQSLIVFILQVRTWCYVRTSCRICRAYTRWCRFLFFYAESGAPSSLFIYSCTRWSSWSARWDVIWRSVFIRCVSSCHCLSKFPFIQIVFESRLVIHPIDVKIFVFREKIANAARASYFEIAPHSQSFIYLLLSNKWNNDWNVLASNEKCCCDRLKLSTSSTFWLTWISVEFFVTNLSQIHSSTSGWLWWGFRPPVLPIGLQRRCVNLLAGRVWVMDDDF